MFKNLLVFVCCFVVFGIGYAVAQEEEVGPPPAFARYTVRGSCCAKWRTISLFSTWSSGPLFLRRNLVQVLWTCLVSIFSLWWALDKCGDASNICFGNSS